MTPTIQTIDDLYHSVHLKFPVVARMADASYAWCFGEKDETLKHLWFETLAKVLNAEMGRGVSPARHEELFGYFAGLLGACSKEVRSCIDVALVENLFHDVDADKAAPFWKALPQPLKALYLGFHGRPPR